MSNFRYRPLFPVHKFEAISLSHHKCISNNDYIVLKIWIVQLKVCVEPRIFKITKLLKKKLIKFLNEV